MPSSSNSSGETDLRCIEWLDSDSWTGHVDFLDLVSPPRFDLKPTHPDDIVKALGKEAEAWSYDDPFMDVTEVHGRFMMLNYRLRPWTTARVFESVPGAVSNRLRFYFFSTDAADMLKLRLVFDP